MARHPGFRIFLAVLAAVFSCAAGPAAGGGGLPPWAADGTLLQNGGFAQDGKGGLDENMSDQGKPLMSPEEILAMPHDEQIKADQKVVRDLRRMLRRQRHWFWLSVFISTLALATSGTLLWLNHLS